MSKIAPIDPLLVLKRLLKRGGEIKAKDLLAQLAPGNKSTNRWSVVCPCCQGRKLMPHKHNGVCAPSLRKYCGNFGYSTRCRMREGDLVPCTRCKQSGRIPFRALILKPG